MSALYLPLDVIDTATARAAILGIGADRILIAGGNIDEETYLRALSGQLGASQVVAMPHHGVIKRRGRPRELASIIEGILRKRAEPMTRSELANELEQRGYLLTSTDKAAYIGTILWRHRSRFTNIEGKGYWLKGVKVPETIEEKFRIRQGAGYFE